MIRVLRAVRGRARCRSRFAGSIPVMLVLLSLAGSLRRALGSDQRRAGRPPRAAGAVTEAYTWEMTAVVAGFALGGVLSGVLVEGAGVREALLAAAALAAVVGRDRLGAARDAARLTGSAVVDALRERAYATGLAGATAGAARRSRARRTRPCR